MYVPNGLARAMVRFKPSAFAGTFVALLMASMIMTACGILLSTGQSASVPPGRYAGAPVVATADQRAYFTTGSGEQRAEKSVALPDTARLDNSLVAKAGSVPGVARAVPDISFPVRTDETAATGHNWGSTAFTDTTLTSGTAPRTGQVVTTAEAATGDRITLDTPAGERDFTVSGTASGPPAYWFADTQAQQLSGHPGQVEAIAIFPKPGISPDALAGQVGEALGDRAEIYTGDARAAAEDTGLASAKSVLTGLGGSFGVIAAMVAVFTAAGTVALSVGQRRREFALLRAIGATPRQIRRTVAAEALLVAPAAALLGCLPGVALAHWWFSQLRDKGAIPQAVNLNVSWIALAIAVGTTLLTALCAGYLAARRPAKTKPGLALAESAIERLRPGWIRTPLGLAAVVGGALLARTASHETGADAANLAMGVVMSFMVAVALLGPLIARACASLFGLPLRAAGAPGTLAAANSRTHSRRLASAITPIILAMSFSAVLVFLHSSTDRATEDQRRAGITASQVITAPPGAPGLPSDAVARAASVHGVDTAVGITRTSVLFPAVGEGLATASAQGFTGTGANLAKVENPGVRTGSLAALEPGTVALGTSLADRANVSVGKRIELTLPDGTKSDPTVVATYDRGLGLSDVTLSQADLTPHVTNPAPALVLTSGAPNAATGLATVGKVTDAGGFATEQVLGEKVGAWSNFTMAAVLGGFAAVAAANTLVMTVLDRRRELKVLGLIGTTRRQTLRMIRWEALLVTGIGIVLGTAIALAALIPMTKGLTGETPYIPPLVYGSFAGGILVLGLAATSLPARAALRRGPSQKSA